MKLILLILLFSVSRCENQIMNKIHNYDCVILESTGENDKPIPILIFCDNLIYFKEYKDRTTINGLIVKNSTVYIKEYVDKIVFRLKKEIVNQAGEITNDFSDTSIIEKVHPFYKITLITDKHVSIKYVNSEEQLKKLFNNLERILKANDLLEASVKVSKLRKRLFI